MTSLLVQEAERPDLLLPNDYVCDVTNRKEGSFSGLHLRERLSTVPIEPSVIALGEPLP